MAGNRATKGMIRIGAGVFLSLLAVGLMIVVTPFRQQTAHAAPGPTLPREMSPEIVKAVELGLRRLSECQCPDGSWMSSGGYYGSYPTVMTSLAGLALLAGGSTPESGPYSKNVRKAMDYIINVAEKCGSKDGMICGEGSESQSMYGHGFGMLFLAQCYGLETSVEYQERIKKVLDRGVARTVSAQSKKRGGSPGGGWYYTPESSRNNDEGSVTVTQLHALRAARNVGIKVPTDAIKASIKYLKFCSNRDGGISYSADRRGSSRPAISAAAIACFYAAGVFDRQSGDGSMTEEAEMVKKLVEYCKTHAKPQGSSDSFWYYTQFYMTAAMYQRGVASDWASHYKDVAAQLLREQSPDGYWNGDNIGNVYGTSLACIMLQMPYGYLPIFQK